MLYHHVVQDAVLHSTNSHRYIDPILVYYLKEKKTNAQTTAMTHCSPEIRLGLSKLLDEVAKK